MQQITSTNMYVYWILSKDYELVNMHIVYIIEYTTGYYYWVYAVYNWYG